MPERIQLRRTKGWRLPAGAVSVARPTKWGNPFRYWHNRGWWAEPYDWERCGIGYALLRPDEAAARLAVVTAFRGALRDEWPGLPSTGTIRNELAGRSLACWCPLPAPGEPDICHAAVLLEVANR